MMNFPRQRETRFLEIKQTGEGRPAQLMRHSRADEAKDTPRWIGFIQRFDLCKER